MGVRRREKDPKRVPSLGISEPISNVNKVRQTTVMGTTMQTGGKDSSGIADISNTYVHRGNGFTAVAKVPDKNNKIDNRGVAGHGTHVAIGKGKTYKEAFNNASTKRTEGLKSGEFGKGNPADNEWIKTSREEALKGNPNYKPVQVIKIDSSKPGGRA